MSAREGSSYGDRTSGMPFGRSLSLDYLWAEIEHSADLPTRDRKLGKHFFTGHSLLQGYRPQFGVNSIGQMARVALPLQPRQRICYYPGRLHGGYQVFLLDHLFADCCRSAVTASLKVSFSRSIPPESTLLLEVWPTKAEGRKIFMSGSITPISSCEGEESPAVSAEALFILPKAL